MRIPQSEGRYGIRRWRPEDAGALYDAVVESVGEVGRWLSWCHAGYTVEDAEAWIATATSAWNVGTMYDFPIIERDSGAFVGGVGLSDVSGCPRMANLGYWVRTSHAGQGAATEAARLVARFGFEQLGMRRIEILVAVENLASQRVAAKLGALREGLLRNRVQMNGEMHHAFMHSLVPEDMASWQGPRG
jgi:ribosomal-protein-serine acetyltransferase